MHALLMHIQSGPT